MEFKDEGNFAKDIVVIIALMAPVGALAGTGDPTPSAPTPTRANPSADQSPAKAAVNQSPANTCPAGMHRAAGSGAMAEKCVANP